MEDFFSQYGKVILVIVVLVALIAIVGTAEGSGLASAISGMLREIVNKFDGVFPTIPII